MPWYFKNVLWIFRLEIPFRLEPLVFDIKGTLRETWAKDLPWVLFLCMLCVDSQLKVSSDAGCTSTRCVLNQAKTNVPSKTRGSQLSKSDERKQNTIRIHYCSSHANIAKGAANTETSIGRNIWIPQVCPGQDWLPTSVATSITYNHNPGS